jgi:hypothetical protein
VGEIEGFTQGVGLSYQVDFDALKELVDKVLKGKKKMAQERQQQQQQEDNIQAGDGVVTFAPKKEVAKEAKKETSKKSDKKQKEEKPKKGA